MRNLTVIALAVCSTVASTYITCRWVAAERRAAYLEGQQAVYQSFATDGSEGTKYVK